MRLDICEVYLVVQILLLLRLCSCALDGICDRRPLGTTTEPLAPDNQFQIEVDPDNIREDRYIPKRTYDVRLFARDNASSFIAFSISLGPDTLYNKDNPRRPIILNPGSLEPASENAVRNLKCNNTIIQTDITPKREVRVKWTAPFKDNKCVTIFAVVAVQPDVWYNYDGPLSKTICEDSRKADDMLPTENSDCKACVDARYQMTFIGMWSPNTHSRMYPVSKDLARFSDVVGASHSKEFNVFRIGFEATQGLKLLAEQGNTTILEMEILDMLDPEESKRYVRTLIKASAPPTPNDTTLANFRVTPRHHLVSIVAGLLPSPDWFLGVSNLELCNADSNKWADRVTINLYPLDAGTDSGMSFESANEATAPPQPIKGWDVIGTVKPFGKLVFDLVRTYTNPNCTDEFSGTDQQETTDSGEDEGGDEGGDREKEPSSGGDGDGDNKERPQPTTTTSEEPPPVDPTTQDSECPMTTWGEWDPCDGDCEDNMVRGYQARYRQHAVDSPTAECIRVMSTTDFQPCEEECQPEEEQKGDEEEEYEE